MGAVFKALDTTLDRIVAVKVVASQQISNEDLQRRFLVEAQSTARLDHPNIARIHYVGRDRGLPYIVFEYIEGINLRDLVANHGAIPVGDALSYTCQIAHALAHAWQKEVVHRDIKPSNILITPDGQAKLVDMGLARLHHVETQDDDLTNTGVTLGTFDYISPEQARDPREADTRSDIYSLGCTLFYMLVGKPPFAEGTAVQKLLKHQDQVPPILTSLQPNIPDSVAQLTHSMLAKAPELRPQTPTDLVKRCYQIFQELGIQPPTSLPPLQIAAAPQINAAWVKHLPWMIPIALLLLIAMLWEVSLPKAGMSVEFLPVRRPTVNADDAIVPDDATQPSETELPAETLTAPEPLAELPGTSSQGEPQPTVRLPETISNWESYAPEEVSPLSNSLLDFPSGENNASVDTAEQEDFELNFDAIILSE